MTSRPIMRLGKSPQELGISTGGGNCPDVWVLDDGDVMLIGTDVTADLRNELPDRASVGDHEAIIYVPRKTFLSAASAI